MNRPLNPKRQHPPLSLSISHRFVWYRVAKTGTRSLHTMLGAHVPDYAYLDRNERLDAEQRALFRNGPFTFTIVRNPWGRLFSAWRNKVGSIPSELGAGEDESKWVKENLGRLRKISGDDVVLADQLCHDFSLFVRLLSGSALLSDRHFMPQTSILGDVRLDHIGRFERYSDEVHNILDRIGLPAGEIPILHKNRSSEGTDYRAQFDDETRRIVADLYSADIERWGYTFES